MAHEKKQISPFDKLRLENLELRFAKNGLTQQVLHHNIATLEKEEQQLLLERAALREELARTYGVDLDTMMVTREGSISGEAVEAPVSETVEKEAPAN